MIMRGSLIIAGLLVAVAAIIAMPYSDTVPSYLVNPGPLSQPHAFLESRCNACHTPIKGVEASNCVVCHAKNDALLQRAPTAFHGNIETCKECHTEHGGRIEHPIAMDHAVVAGKPDAKVNECYSCHQSTLWNDIKGVGWYKSH